MNQDGDKEIMKEDSEYQDDYVKRELELEQSKGYKKLDLEEFIK